MRTAHVTASTMMPRSRPSPVPRGAMRASGASIQANPRSAGSSSACRPAKTPRPFSPAACTTPAIASVTWNVTASKRSLANSPHSTEPSRPAANKDPGEPYASPASAA